MTDGLAGTAVARRDMGRVAVLLLASVACLVTVASMLLDLDWAGRVAAALVMLCVAPGAAALPLMAGRSGRIELAMVFATSLAFFAVAAQVMLWAHLWEPEVATYVVALMCLGAIVPQLVRLALRRPRADGTAAQAAGLAPSGYPTPPTTRDTPPPAGSSQQQAAVAVQRDAAVGTAVQPAARSQSRPGLRGRLARRGRRAARPVDSVNVTAGRVSEPAQPNSPDAPANVLPPPIRKLIDTQVEEFQRSALGAGPALRTRTTAVHGVAIAVAAAGWIIALVGADLGRISGYGLLPALPPTYYVALGILACGFALAVASRNTHPAVLVAYVAALIVVLHATTAVLYSEPRYAWVYKHLGVIDWIATQGETDRFIDIYNNWPGFFALNAWFSEAGAVAPIGYAAWAQVFFELANVAAIVFALRAVTRDARLLWSAAWLFIVANWIGQDYLAPQAFTFTLVVVLIGLALRWGVPVRWTVAPSPRTRLGRRLSRLGARLAATARGPTPGPPATHGAGTGPRAALALGALCYLAVVISHQLSPVMAILSIAILAIVTRRVPLWVLAGLVVIEVWWLWLSYDFVSEHFELLDVDPSASARPLGYDLDNGLPGVAFGSDVSRATIAVMVLLAAVGVLRRLRARLWDAAPAVLIIAPVIVIAGQSYGGEGPLRGYLFALPWLAYFGAVACLPGDSARTTLGRSWRLLAVTAVVGTGSLFGYFGQEMLNRMSADDVAASRWFLDNSPRESSLTNLDSNFPERLNFRYAYHLESPTTFIRHPEFEPHPLGPADVETLKAELGDDLSPPKYVAISPSQVNYATFYRLVPPQSIPTFVRALRASPDFRLVFRQGSAYVFRYSPRPPP